MQAASQRRAEAASAAIPQSKAKQSNTSSANKQSGSKTQGGHRKVNLGQRASGGTGSKRTMRPNEDLVSASSTLNKKMKEATPELAINSADQERLAILEQIQDQIFKKGTEVSGSSLTPEEGEEIERLLHGLVSMSHNAAMELMNTNQTRAAGRTLRQCAEFIESKVPRPVAVIVVQKGIMHAVYNNMAQHANMTADMNLSIEYLAKALEAAEQPETQQELLPLAETYLNLANGYSFLTRYDQALKYGEKALRFARLRCNQLRDEIQDERNNSSADAPSQKVESLDYQLNDFIAIKIMAHLCIGEQQEKLGSFNAAIKSYSEGQKFSETNFGIKHPLYTKCVNAMGGAKLKSKYQTKENYRNVENSGNIQKLQEKNVKIPPTAARKERKGNKASIQPADNSIKSKLMARRLQGSDSLPNRAGRRNIQGAMVKATEVRMSNMMRNSKANLLMQNCDQWTSMQSRHPRPQSKQSLIVNMQKQKAKGRLARPSSVQSERRMTREQHTSGEILSSTPSNKRAPYKVVCKNGPGCKNHDWHGKSPLQKVDRNSSFRSSRQAKNTRCNTQQQEYADEGMGNTQRSVTLNDTQQSMHLQSEGPKDLSHRSVMIDETQQIDNQSTGGHSCTVNQNERIHQQQMEQMRTMQEDQFKMLQLVMENSQSKQTAGQLASSQQMQQMQQQQQNYMQYAAAAAVGGYYQPPQFYNQGNYGGYSQPMYHQYAGSGAQQQSGYNNWQDQQGYPTDESATETDQMSDAEQIRAGQQPAQSELSKAEMLEQAYSQQQQEMIDMQQRMSQMQHEYNDQVALIRESKETFKANKYAKSARELQTLSQSQRDYKEDDGGNVDEKRDEVTAQKLIMKDVSAQAFDTMKQSSILKQSTIKSRGVNYHDSVMEGKGGNDSSKSPDLRSDISNSFTKASPYRMSVNQSQRSMARSSFVTEKSFRIPGGKHKISRNEAAILIQKNYLRFRHRQDFKMVIKRKIQKKFLFKATIRSGQNTTKLLTCSLNMRGNGGKIESITFIIGDSLRSSSRHNEKIQIDLRSYDIQDTTDMKDKVLRIIKDALAAEEINQRVVEECFQSRDAKEILEADFFTSDDYSAQVQQPRTQNLRPPRAAIASRSSQQINEQTEEQSAHFKQSNAKERSQDRIAAEIAAIRKRCEVKCVIGIGSVKVKGHKREMDAFDDDDGDDETLTRNFGVDSDEEENTKHIFLSQVNIRKNGKDSGRGEVVFNSDAASSDDDSQHDYQFIIGGRNSALIQKQPGLAKIVRVQALVRGFLARLRKKHQSSYTCLFNRILKMEDKLIKFMLVKNGSMSYKLSAQAMMGKKLTESKYLTQLPFADSDATDKFELSLVFSMTPNEITELDLKSDEVEPAIANPFLDTNLFILDYKPKNNSGDHLIKSWKLRDTYPCEFFQVNSTQDTSYFKVVVTHRAKTSYLKLHKLPEDIKYMAYYFNEVLMVSLDATQVLQYIYLVVLPDKPTFKRQMRELEARYFLQKSSSVRPKTAKIITNKQRYNTVSATSAAAALPVSTTSAAALRRQDTMAKATKAREFWIIRDSKEYLVEVFDETQSKGRYQIFVSKKDDPFDKDSVCISQITLFMDEMISYIKENLKIYTRPDGKIDYLSLSNDTTIFNMKNKRRVRESLSQVRVKDNTNLSVRGSSVKSSSIRNSIESHGNMSRIVPQLKDKLSEFKIERNETVYVVNVQERKNYAERPLQITVTAVDDSRDTRYIVYHNKEQKSDSELISYLQSNLCVYTKQDEMMKRQMIQYVSLTQAQVTYRRSSTMTMGDEQFLVAATKKSMVKARASKPRNSILETSPQKHMKNLTIDNTTFRSQKDLLRDFSPNLDPNWEELTRETVILDNGKADAILMASTQETISLPPKNNSDVEYYRIILMHCLDRKILAECDLSPQASNWLFRVRPNFLDRNSSRLTVSELMQLQSQSATYDASQIDLLKQSSSYEANKTEWAQILQHVRYEAGEVKFDLWSLCQSRTQQKSVSNKLIQSRPKTVSIQSKLNSSRRGLTQTAMVLSSTTEEIKTCNTCESKIDQGNNLGDTLTDLRKDTPSQQSHDQPDNNQSQQQTEQQMVSKRPVTTSLGQQNINEL